MIINAHIILKGKSNAMKLTVSDKWQEFLCPLGKKEPDVRKSRDRKIEHFEFTPVDHIHQ